MMGGGRGGGTGSAISTPRGGGGGSAGNVPAGRPGVGMGGGHIGARPRGDGYSRYGQGRFHGGPIVTYGFGTYGYPYSYDYYNYPNYQGAECWRRRTVRGRYRRVWVCN
jgi:hypothetical protein